MAKGMFRKIEVKNVPMLVADYKKNSSSVLIAPFDSAFFHDEGEYLFIEPTEEDLRKNPRKVSFFGEIYPVHCLQVIKEPLLDKTMTVHKSSFFLYSSQLKKNDHDTVILFRSYAENNYCLIEIQSKNQRDSLSKLLKRRCPQYAIEKNDSKKTITITTPKRIEKHYTFYNRVIDCIKIILE